jgi:pseudoazurin
MLIRKLQIVFMLVLFGIGLTACGDNDSEPTDKSKSTAPAVVEESAMAEEVPAVMVSEAPVSEVAPGKNISDGLLSAYDPDHPSMTVEDNGVVSEEEIYKAWPKEAPAASVDSASTEAEAPAPVATETKMHTVIGQATSFGPNILFINPGDTVQWANMTIHDSVSMEGLIPEGAEPWKFNIGQNGAVTLTKEGVHIYKCNPHYSVGMVAAIIVGKPVNIKEVQANATGRSKGIVIKVVKALASR